MLTIILESVLFVALLVTAGALVFFVLKQFTPVGVWLQQGQNRRQIEQAAELECPRHGSYTVAQLVRLPGGERVCPRCYEEIVHGPE